MSNRSSSRGYSLIEVLLTVAVLGLLLFAVGTAVTHVLQVEVLGANRQAVLRSSNELDARMNEEARSSTAVFVPSTDVLGQPNAGPNGGHEVDFFRKGSDGTLTFVAYRWEVQSGAVTRYEYVPGAPNPQILHADLMAENISSLAAVRTSPSSIGSIVGGGSVQPVNVYFGTPELVGGNGIVTVAVVGGTAGEPQRSFTMHLSARAAPTDVAIAVPSGTPPPTPGPSPTPILYGFLLKSTHVQPPHGPNHGGDPGGGDPGGGIHGGGIPGSAEFYGTGAGNTDSWFELTSLYSQLVDGTYSYKNSHGDLDTVTISCDGNPCPQFVPLPVPTSGSTILFHTTQ